MPLDRPPWGGLFGMCTDRFGVHWMISVADAASCAVEVHTVHDDRTVGSNGPEQERGAGA